MPEDDLSGNLGPEHDDDSYTWVGDRRGVKAPSATCSTAERYYGNEASTTTFYASAALDHGAAGGRARQDAAAAAHGRPRPRHEGARSSRRLLGPRPRPSRRPRPSGRRRARRRSAAGRGDDEAPAPRDRGQEVYAEPEVVDDSEDDSEAEDGTKIKPKLPVSACGCRGGLRRRRL